jgi:hypothetical protein
MNSVARFSTPNSRATHDLGVELVTEFLSQWLTPCPPKSNLPRWSICQDRACRITDSDLPRDLKIRLGSGECSVKVYQVSGSTGSSLYRSIAYEMMAKQRGLNYLQVVSGVGEDELQDLLDFHDQAPLSTEHLTGIRHLFELGRHIQAELGLRTPGRSFEMPF